MFAECGSAALARLERDARTETPVYGNYYATGFKFANTVDESGVLWLVWTKEGGAWRTAAFTVLTS